MFVGLSLVWEVQCYTDIVPVSVTLGIETGDPNMSLLRAEEDFIRTNTVIINRSFDCRYLEFLCVLLF